MKSETFGELIRRLRAERDLSLRGVASQIDFDQSSLSKVERNEMLAPPRLIKPLSKVLNIGYKELQVRYLSEKLFYELKHQDYALEAIEIARKRLEREGRGTTFELQRKKLLKKLREYLRKKPIEKAWLFGSFARETESKDSDIDLLVRFEQPNDIDLFDYVGLRQELEELTGRQVDLVEEGYLIPEAEENIKNEKTLIYERKAG
jgi:predicted nucleotidyltransferase